MASKSPGHMCLLASTRKPRTPMLIWWWWWWWAPLKRSVCQFWFFIGFHVFSMVFQGSLMIFHGFRLVSMVFQGSFKVFDGFGWFFQGSKVSKWLSNIFEYFWLISSSHCLDNWLGVFPISLNFFTFNYFPLPTFQIPLIWLSVFPIDFNIFE